MAAQLRRVNRTLGQMQKNLECSICLELLKDPVSTKCDHQFCNFCILTLLDNSRNSSAVCPLCKEPVTKRSLTSNDRLNEIVQAVRGVVQAVEEDTGFRCTPPRGPRVLSQQSKSSLQSATKPQENESIRPATNASTKISKAKRASKKRNLRQTKPRTTGSISIYEDSDDSDGSEASTRGIVLITDFDSSLVEGKLARKSSRKTANRKALQPDNQKPLQPANQKPLQPANQKPLQPANQKPLQPSTQEVAIKQTQSKRVSSSSKKILRPSIPLNDKQQAANQQNGQISDGSHILQALDEDSLGILKVDGMTQREISAGDKEKKKHLRGANRNYDGCLLQAFDQESLGMHTDVAVERKSLGRSKTESSLVSNLLQKANKPDDRDEPTNSSGVDAVSIIICDAGSRDRRNNSSIRTSQKTVPELQFKAGQANMVNSFDHKDTSKMDNMFNISGGYKVSGNETSQLSADKHPEDDPYEFIASQRTPRKPKRGRRQKNPSGKASKEFDYMKWNKGGGVEKRLLLGSQAVFSQSAVQSQVLSATLRAVGESLQPLKDHSFRKPSEIDGMVLVDKKQQSQNQQAIFIEPTEPTGCNSVPDGEGPASHQRVTRSRHNKQDTSVKTVQCSREDNIKKQGKTANSAKDKSDISVDLHSKATGVCPTAENGITSITAKLITKPNMRGKQQKTKSCNQLQKNNEVEQSQLPEEPPARRLRSRAKTQGTNKENIEVQHNEWYLTKSNQPSVSARKGSNDDDQWEARNRDRRPEGQAIQKGGDIGEALKEVHLSSDEEDNGDYRFEDGSFHSDSDGESTPVSLSDLSFEPSTELTKYIPELFHEANPKRIRQSRHTELDLVNAPVHHGPPVHETTPHEENEDMPEVMECSQPIVKKHSPLASAGVFGQVYKRGSLLLPKNPREGDLVILGEENMVDDDEKVQKIYPMEDDLCSDFEEESLESLSDESVEDNHRCNTGQDKDADLKKSDEMGSDTPLEGISQCAVSQPDLFDKDNETEDDSDIDLSEGSDAEDSMDEQRNLQSDLSDQVREPPPCNGLQKETPQNEGLPGTEKPQHDAAATKSDWELALELAREFDTEPRQFSLRSSRRGRIELKPNDDFVQPSRTKPELDVSVKNKRSRVKSGETEGAAVKIHQVQADVEAVVCETSEIQKDHCTSRHNQASPHRLKSKKNENHIITAGRKTLRQPQRSVRSEVRKEKVPNSREKRRSIRRSSGLPTTCHKVVGSSDGMIESCDSNVDCQMELVQPSLETAKPSVQPFIAGEVLVPYVNPDLWFSKSSTKEVIHHQDAAPSQDLDHNKESMQEVQEDNQSKRNQSNWPSSSAGSNNITERTHASKKRTCQYSGKGRGVVEYTSPTNNPNKTANDGLDLKSIGSGFRRRQLRSSSQSKERSISPRCKMSCRANTENNSADGFSAMHGLSPRANISLNGETKSVAKDDTQPMLAQTNLSITMKSGLPPEVASQHSTGSSSLFTEDFRGEQQQKAEKHLEHTPRRTHCQMPEQTREQKGRRNSGCGEPESDEGDTTVSIDLGVVEHVEEKNAETHQDTSVAATSLSGSDTDSIELLEDADDIRFIPPISITEPKAQPEKKLRKNQAFKSRRMSVTQNHLQSLKKGSRVRQAKSEESCSLTPDPKIRTPEQTSQGKTAKKTKKRNRHEPAETDEVSAKNSSIHSRNLPKSNWAISVERPEEVKSNNLPQNTVPETIPSEASPNSSSITTLSDGSTKKKATGKSEGLLASRSLQIPKSASEQMQSPQLAVLVTGRQKASPGPPSLKPFKDSSSNQESEKMLVPPPAHYQTTFIKNYENQSISISQESSQEELLSSTWHLSRPTSKRKSCPEERCSAELKPSSKRHRSAGATVSEIQHWKMGSRRRSERLSKAGTSAVEMINSCELPKELEDISSPLESAGDISGGFVIMETEDSVASSIQTLRKSRSHGSLSKSQQSLAGGKVAVVSDSMSSQKALSTATAASPQQDRQFTQKSQQDDVNQELSGLQMNNGPQAGLGSHSLFEEDDTGIGLSKKLSRSQVPHQIPHSYLVDESLGRTESSENIQTATAGSSLFCSPKIRSPTSSVKSSRGNKKRKHSLKQESGKIIKGTPEVNSESAAKAGSTSLLQNDLTHGQIIDSTQSLFTENGFEHSKKEHNALSSNPSSSLKSSGTSRTSLSIPYHGKLPQEVNKIGNIGEDIKQTAGVGRRKRFSPSSAPKPLSEDFVEASEGASVSPEFLSGPIIISRKYFHGQGKDINSSPPGKNSTVTSGSKNRGSQDEKQGTGSLNKKKFSFRRKSLKNRDLDVSISSPRELDGEVVAYKNQHVSPIESINRSSSTVSSRQPNSGRKKIHQMDNSCDDISPGASENVHALSSSSSQKSKLRKRKSSTFTAGKAKQSRNSETKHSDDHLSEDVEEKSEEVDNKRDGDLLYRKSHQARSDDIMKEKRGRRDLQKIKTFEVDCGQSLGGLQTGNDVNKCKEMKTRQSSENLQNRVITDDELEEEVDRPHGLNVAKNKINDRNPKEADSHVAFDSSGDVEMVSAEDDEPHCHDNTKDTKEDKDDDVSEDDVEEEDDDDDDDDDVIIPPTPPCQSTTILQTKKRPAYLIHSASSISSSYSICSSKRLPSKHSKENHQPKDSSIRNDARCSSQGSGCSRKAHKNPIKDDSSQTFNLSCEKAELKDATKNTEEIQDSEVDEMLDNSFVKRAFPLSSIPFRNDASEDRVKEFREKAAGIEDASENSQSLGIFKEDIGEDFLRGNFRRSPNNRSTSRKRRQNSDYTTEEVQEETRCGDEKGTFGRGPRDRSTIRTHKIKQQKDKAREEHFENFVDVGRRGIETESDSRKAPIVLIEDRMIEKAQEIKENGEVEAGGFHETELDHEDEDMLVSTERHYDTEGSTCSESSCSHHLNLTSASSVLSSQSELMNTQQQLKAKESLKKMALEIAQIEAVLADDTDTHKKPDSTPVKHPDTTPDKHPKNAEEHSDLSQDKNCDKLQLCSKDHGNDNDHVDHNSPFPASDDLCTPAYLCTPADLYSNDSNQAEPADVCSVKVIGDSHIDNSSTNPTSQRSSKSQRLAHSILKRSRPVISDDESESDEDEVMKYGRNIESLDDDNSLENRLPRNRLEIPGVTTYGSDSEMSEQEEPHMSSGSPRSSSPLRAPRSPSPPPDLSQSTARRASSLANLPESVKAVSRLAEKIRFRRSTDRLSFPREVGKSWKENSISKRLVELPRRHTINDSDSSDEEDYRRSSSPKRHSRHAAEVANSRSVSGRDTTLGSGASGWKSKSIEMQSDHHLENKNRKQQGNVGSKNNNNTPVRKSRQPGKTVLDIGLRSHHSKQRDDKLSQRSKGLVEKNHSSKRGEDQNDGTTGRNHLIRRGDQQRDESPEERAPSPVIGRSLLTTPASKKKTKPMSLVTTGLNRTDMRNVEQLTKLFGCRFASTFNACTTHVIVNTTEDFVCERTLKYFQGIAARVWVVSFKWVSACLKTDELLAEEPFEVLGDVVNGPSHYGPRRARLWRGPYPLHKYDVCCVGPFTGLNKEQLVSLLELIGASTVQHPSLFPYSAGRKAVVIAQAEATDLDYDYDALYKKYRVPVISREWILDIIATYKIQPMADYLLSPSGSSQPITDLDSDKN